MKNQLTLLIIVLLTGNAYKTGKEDAIKKNCTEGVLNEYTEFCTILERERRVLDLYEMTSGIRLVHV